MSQLTRNPSLAHSSTEACPVSGVVLEPVAESPNLPSRVLSPGEYVVGSGVDCDVVVPASGVARRHCRVTVGAQTNRVSAESPLTWINDGIVRDGRLRTGDRLIVGPIEFRIREPNAAELHELGQSHPEPVSDRPADDLVETVVDDADARKELTSSVEATVEGIEHHQQQLERETPPAPGESGSRIAYGFAQDATPARDVPTSESHRVASGSEAAIDAHREYLTRLAETLDSRERELVAREAEVKCQWDEIAVTRVGSREWEEAVYDERTVLSRERAELKSQRREIEAVRDEIAEERIAIETRREELMRQEEKLEETRRELDELRVELIDRQAEVDGRERQLTESRSMLDNERAELARREQDLVDEANRLQRDREELERQTQHAADLSNERAEQLASEKEQLQARQDELTRSLEEYQASMERLEASQCDLDRSWAQLEERRSTFESERAESEAIRRAIDEERVELTAREREFDAREALLSAAEREVSEQRQQLAREQEEAAHEAQRMVESSRQQAEELVHEKAEIQAQQEELQLRQEQLQASLDALDASRLDLDGSWGEFEASRADCDAERERLAAIQRSIDEERADIAARRGELDAREASLSAAEREVSEESRRLEREREEISQQSLQVAETSSEERKRLESEREQLRVQREELQARQDEQQAALVALQASRSDLDRAWAELEETRSGLEAEREGLETIRRVLDDERAELTARVAELDSREETEADTESVHAASSEIPAEREGSPESNGIDAEEVTEELRRLAEERESLEAAKAEVLRDRAVLDEKYQSLELERSRLEEERAAWSAEQAAVQEEASSARWEMEQLQVERADLQAERESLEAERCELQRQLSEYAAHVTNSWGVETATEVDEDETYQASDAIEADDDDIGAEAAPDSVSEIASRSPADSEDDVMSSPRQSTAAAVATDEGDEASHDDADPSVLDSFEANGAAEAEWDEFNPSSDGGDSFAGGEIESGSETGTISNTGDEEPESDTVDFEEETGFEEEALDQPTNELRSQLAEMFGITTDGSNVEHESPVDGDEGPVVDDSEASSETVDDAPQEGNQDAVDAWRRYSNQGESAGGSLSIAELMSSAADDTQQDDRPGDEEPSDHAMSSIEVAHAEELSSPQESQPATDVETEVCSQAAESPEGVEEIATVDAGVPLGPPGEDDPISEYMEKLLQRHGVSAAVEGEIDEGAASEEEAIAAATIELQSEIAKSVAPEEKEALRAHLDSFRELANISARTAVAKHESKKLRTVVQVKVVLTTISVGLTAALASAHLIGNISYLPYTIAAAVVSAVMGGDTMRTLLTFYRWRSIESAGAGNADDESSDSTAETSAQVESNDE